MSADPKKKATLLSHFDACAVAQRLEQGRPLPLLTMADGVRVMKALHTVHKVYDQYIKNVHESLQAYGQEFESDSKKVKVMDMTIYGSPSAGSDSGSSMQVYDGTAIELFEGERIMAAVEMIEVMKERVNQVEEVLRQARVAAFDPRAPDEENVFGYD
jgi:hypothetical protein